jgi:hypothetical protein
MAESAPQRIVPGAPPPPPLLSKSQRKKRKTKAKSTEPESPNAIPESMTPAVVEKVPEMSDEKPGPVASDVSQREAQTPQVVEDESLYKPSPIVELINKRLKA